MAKRNSEDSKVLISFGRRLRAFRLSKGLTPSQFSRAMGIGKEKLQKYESGKLEPKLVTIMTMAEVLQISHLDLLVPDTEEQ